MVDIKNITLVDDESFETEVLRADKPVLLLLGASWCGPCQRQMPILEKFADDNSKIKVCKVDIDDSPDITKKLGIRSVPALMLFSGGKSVGNQVGLTSLSAISVFVSTKTNS